MSVERRVRPATSPISGHVLYFRPYGSQLTSLEGVEEGSRSRRTILPTPKQRRRNVDLQRFEDVRLEVETESRGYRKSIGTGRNEGREEGIRKFVDDTRLVTVVLVQG